MTAGRYVVSDGLPHDFIYGGPAIERMGRGGGGVQARQADVALLTVSTLNRGQAYEAA